MHFADGFGLIQRGDLVRARDAQHRAAAQNIDVPAEGVGIRAIHRHHGLIDARRRIGVQAARDLGERIALADPISPACRRPAPPALRRRWAGEQAREPQLSAGAAGAGAARRAGAAATVGAVTGAALLAVSPGVYTGGSSNTVYSRIRRPRAQLTSTKNVTNGSGMASVERTSKARRGRPCPCPP